MRPEKRYRPSAALDRAVRARDVTCRFPGCRRSADSAGTDLDHTIPWPEGPTSATNLAVLCRRHHRLKHTPGWNVQLDPTGVMTWTTPTGRTNHHPTLAIHQPPPTTRRIAPGRSPDLRYRHLMPTVPDLVLLGRSQERVVLRQWSLTDADIATVVRAAQDPAIARFSSVGAATRRRVGRGVDRVARRGRPARLGDHDAYRQSGTGQPGAHRPDGRCRRGGLLVATRASWQGHRHRGGAEQWSGTPSMYSALGASSFATNPRTSGHACWRNDAAT